jgi:hypothetical protein
MTIHTALPPGPSPGWDVSLCAPLLASANRPLRVPLQPLPTLRTPPLLAARRPPPSLLSVSLVLFALFSGPVLSPLFFCLSLTLYCFSSTPSSSRHQLLPVPGPDPARAPHRVWAGSGPGTGRNPRIHRGSGVDTKSTAESPARSARGMLRFVPWRQSRGVDLALPDPMQLDSRRPAGRAYGGRAVRGPYLGRIAFDAPEPPDSGVSIVIEG